ncbi:M56 family metallopeptidase [Singulisphaera acidiphila]|uniref:Antirepressor regulating drug resistance protein n=1 Tax=Singulisphaera acidiphila (strain ATCC BAA-1392 / DSM 18658 / VKM B-2454 / MOB10) TaxID=886293 RepID=L0DP12_SINAD|nr:M56 family metallopeptidase [Singulisphaera acidiphila]AGA30593.1 antirepressor regulating drug resistance protein [Singulisphaera acidiphila DSM 18658]
MIHGLDDFARLVWAQLWQVTVVALVIGAAVRLCCRERPRLAYALWMLVIVKAIVPPVWASPTGLFSWGMVNRVASRPEFTETPPIRHAAAPVAASIRGGLIRGASGLEGGTSWDDRRDEARLPLLFAAFSIWATGAVLCTAFVFWKQIACSFLIRRSRLPVDERYDVALAQLSRRLGVRRRVGLLMTSRPIGPAVFGLFRPTILLPEPLLSGQSLEQVQLVLAHELIHVRRGDIFAGKLQLVAQVVWWFHPLVWWANREACRERERCCDEEVVSGVGCKPVLYARTLLSVLEQKGRLRSLVAIPGVRALEVTTRRLESIMKYAGTDHRRASWISRLVFATGAILIVPGAGLVLRADPPAIDNKPNAPTARAVDEGSAKAPPAAQGDGAKSQESPLPVRSEFAFERLGEWVGLGILTRPETLVIRKGLRLTDDQVEKIRQLKELREANLALGIHGPGVTTFEQLTAFVNRETGEGLVKILTATQCKRSEQIILTSHGVRAFRYPDVRKDLRLTPEQAKKIDAVIDALFAQLNDLQKGSGGQPKDLEGSLALEERIAPLWKGAFAQVFALLTQEQAAQWKAMVGVPFLADEAESRPTPMER